MPVLNYDSKTPLYEQLYLEIKKEIESGKIKPNEKMPSKRNLAKMLKISEITVQNAYEQLKDEGYIYSVEKSGYFAMPIEVDYSPALKAEIKAEERKEAERESYAFDLRGEKTDIDNFPFSVWSKLTRQVLSEQRQSLLVRTDNRGTEELRIEIANYLRKYRGIDADYNNIIIGAGTEYMLDLLSRLLPQSVFAFENPGYQKASKVLKAAGAKTVHIPLDNDGIIIDELRKSNADIVYVTPSHHFPLGRVMPIKRRYELLSETESKTNSYIIEDDYDSEFRFSGRPIPTLFGIDKGERVIYLGTFTQSLCPSLRISYMLLPDRLMKKYDSELSFYSSTVPSFEQYTLLKFLQGGYFERHLNRMRTAYKSRRDALICEIMQSGLKDKITVEGNNAGLTLLIRHKSLNEAQLVERAGKNGVGILGISRYYTDGLKPLEGMVLIGYSSLKGDEIKQVAHRLENAWK